jgi:hypothetical protein
VFAAVHLLHFTIHNYKPNENIQITVDNFKRVLQDHD